MPDPQYAPQGPVAVDADAVRTFRETWADNMLADELATKLTCSELEALAGLFTAFGEPAIAENWRAFHAEGDYPGDLHYNDPDSDKGLDGAPEPAVPRYPVRKYRIIWQTIEHHSTEVSIDELGGLLGVAPDAIDPAAPTVSSGPTIEDALAEVEGGGAFEGLTRDDVIITPVVSETGL